MSKPKKIALIVTFAVAVILFAEGLYWLFTFRVINVPTGAMANTIIPGDRVLCQSISEVKRGDIVVFKLPTDPKVQYIKRVIGLSGETIQLRGTKVLINGQELAEARTFVDPENLQGELKELSSEGAGAYRVFYIKRESWGDEESPGAKYAIVEPFRIPPGHYFVLGDSRDNSMDSRYWGTVPRELIVGKALVIIDSKALNGEKRAFKYLK